MNQLCCFDLDGTLIDSAQDICDAVSLLRETYCLPLLSKAEVIGATGDGIVNLVKRCMPELSGERELSEAVEKMRRCYVKRGVGAALYPGVKTGIANLRRQGLVIALVSNKPSDMCRLLLTRLGVAEHFHFIFGGDSGFPLKPSPEVLFHIMTQAGIADSSICWMLGDHHTDLAFARAGKIHAAYASWGFGNPGNEKIDFYAASFDDFVIRVLDERDC